MFFALKRPWSTLITVFILLVTITFLNREPILLNLGSHLIVQDPLQPAYLIHVLGGDFDRLDYGVKLYERGYGHRIFITGEDDAVAYRNHVISKGVPPEAALPAESWASTTYEEAQELKQHIESDMSIQSVIIVSSPYQMRRARLIFQNVLGDKVRLQFIAVPFEQSSQKIHWWNDAYSRKSVISEYLKIFHFYLKHEIL